MMNQIPKSHPRYQSLMIREQLKQAMHEGIVHETGLIAHGRGEAFDYLLGEQTISSAENAAKTSAAALLLAENPIISVNAPAVPELPINSEAWDALNTVLLSIKTSGTFTMPNLSRKAGCFSVSIIIKFTCFPAVSIILSRCFLTTLHGAHSFPMKSTIEIASSVLLKLILNPL